jgi:hypothetical protein
MRKRILPICLILLFLAILVYLISPQYLDGITDKSFTIMQLGDLCTITELMIVVGEIDVTQFDSLDKLLDAASKEKLLDSKRYENGWYSRDSWKNEIRMRVTQKEQTTLIEFISPGENGVFEDGKGDDLVRRCEFETNRIKKKKRE